MPISKDAITHPGIIHEVGSERIYVKILSQSACSACHAKGACSVSDLEEKLIDVKIPSGKSYNVGDMVTVGMEKSLGSKAVLLGYFIPFLILLFVLITMLAISDNELLSGMLAIGLLIPYYLILYLLKDKLQKTFEFRIKE
ncbi:MAG: SoxR reducing system RseC family protein [Bacteroidales bacterium]|nr:SoxR reducing system RseC family protein [Bacteroidales bacterium]